MDRVLCVGAYDISQAIILLRIRVIKQSNLHYFKDIIMKKADECNNIQDVRDSIDKIDRSLIQLISARSEFVQKAATFKKSEADVRAKDRVASMLIKRRQWATENGVAPDFIETLFKMMVSHFIGRELKEWEQDSSPENPILIKKAKETDLPDILFMQKRAFIQEAELNGCDYNIPPITQDIQSITKEYSESLFLKAVLDGQIAGSVRAKMENSVCKIVRLVVEPLYQGKGIGKKLLSAIEYEFAEAKEFELFTSINSTRNRKFYNNAGYVEESEFDIPNSPRMIGMKKTNCQI
ncbi:MAG TPA: GNAT family N-acetyltransferase [Spirochaetota bacterium]|nr:GNAT family N-acetyltransferase [Spirochaetota bacterium]